MAATNKSLALMSKTPEIGAGIVKGFARSTAFNWASYIGCPKKIIDEVILQKPGWCERRTT
jgi:hypothetical protein